MVVLIVFLYREINGRGLNTAGKKRSKIGAVVFKRFVLVLSCLLRSDNQPANGERLIRKGQWSCTLVGACVALVGACVGL